MYNSQNDKRLGEIVKWLDNKNCRLYQCFNNPKYGKYSNKREFLDELNFYTDALSNSSEGWQGKCGNINISRCLKGLQGLDANTSEVRKLLTVLTDKIHHSKAELNGQAIGNALYGLQNMDATSHEVSNLLKVLTDKIHHSKAELHGQEIGNALYGLQNMDATVQEVKQLIDALEEKNPDYNQLVQNAWVRYQVASSYIALSDNTFKDKQSREDFLNKKLQYIFKEESSNLEVIFYQELVNKYVKDDTLDLHGLDHLTAKYLLNNWNDHLRHSIKVIFGKASHNATSHNVMKMIVDEWIEKHNLSYYNINEGCYNVEQSDKSTLLIGNTILSDSLFN